MTARPLPTEPTRDENENAIAMPRSQWEQLRDALAAVQADYEGREVAFGGDVASGLAMIDTLLAADDCSSRADVKGALVDQPKGPAPEAVSTEWRDGLRGVTPTVDGVALDAATTVDGVLAATNFHHRPSSVRRLRGLLRGFQWWADQ